MSDTPQSKTQETDALIEGMLSGNGIPMCEEWDRIVNHAKTLEAARDDFKERMSLAIKQKNEYDDERFAAERDLEALKHDITRCVQTNTELLQELEQANERLENNHYFKDGKRVECKPGSIPDGIECRNETIKLLERELEEAKSSRDRAMALLDAIHAVLQNGVTIEPQSLIHKRIDALKGEG